MRASKRKRGLAMVLVLVVVAVGVVMGLAYVTSAAVKTTGTHNLVKATEARYLAESGLQHALYVLRTDKLSIKGSDPNHPLGPYKAVEGGEEYVFWAIPDPNSPGRYTVTSSANSGGITQKASLTAICTSGYKDMVMMNDPMGYWRLGESSGSTITDQTGKYAGTYHNVGLGYEGALGDGDKAVHFDGWGDWGNVDTPDFQLKQDLTVVAWVKFDAFPLLGLLGDAFVASGDFGEGRRNNTLFQVGIKKTGDITYKHECLWGLNQKYSWDTNLQLNQWYQITVVRDSAAKQVTLFVDGNKVGVYTYLRDPEYGTDGELYFGIGTAPGLFSCTHGTLDDVAIFDKKLGDTQVQEIYASKAEGESFEIVRWND